MNKKLLIGIGVVAVAYVVYTKFYKKPVTATATKGKEDMSNATGSQCVCANGVSGYCASGDCAKCCASFGVKRSK